MIKESAIKTKRQQIDSQEDMVFNNIKININRNFISDVKIQDKLFELVSIQLIEKAAKI